MNLTDLEYTPSFILRAASPLYRVQRFTHRPGDKRIRRIRMAPPGLLRGRFDLVDVPVACFAESPETAGYECLARRELVAMNFSELAERELICMSVKTEIMLLDLRPFAQSWPVLQSLRYAITQRLAKSAQDAGFEGIIYKSAQQAGMDCMAIFGPAVARLEHVSSERLVDPGTGNLHWLIADLARGAQMKVLP